MSPIKKLADTLVNLTVQEVRELTSILKDHYGIDYNNDMESDLPSPIYCHFPLSLPE